MIFENTKFKDVFVLKHELLIDERGFFSRSWCKKELSEHKLGAKCVQTNISFNKFKGTLRGMHYQEAPYREIKVVRCTRGAIYDVIIDLRKKSKTYLQWMGIDLNEENRYMLYIPKGFAHGFLTLKDNTEVFYQMSEYYQPNAARGVRFNDPAFDIKWPLNDKPLISGKDNNWPDYKI